jgi:HEAT repeat protein
MRRVPAAVGWLALLAAGCGQTGPTLAGGKPVGHWVEALRSSDAKMRKTAVLKLGNLGSADPAALPAVTGALKDPDAAVRREAALALLRNAPAAAEAVPALTAAKTDRDPQVREYAAKALERIQGPK